MSEIIDSGINKIKLSCVTTDKKHGTWWSVGTHNQYVEIRTTKTGRIKVFDVVKRRHPYFTLEAPND